MEEQHPTPPTEEVSPPADNKPTGDSQASEAVSAPDWRKGLDTADPDELLRHPRVAGILGSRIDQAVRRRESEVRTEEKRKAELAREQEFVKLAKENPEVLSERYPGVAQWIQERQEQRAREAEEDRVRNIRESYNKQLAESYGRVPEWMEAIKDPATLRRIQDALQGVPEDQVIGVFNSTAADIVAERRAEKKAEAKLAARLDQERQAIRQEERAKALADGDGPDLQKSTGRRPRVDINKMNEDQFADWWEKTGKKVR